MASAARYCQPAHSIQQQQRGNARRMNLQHCNEANWLGLTVALVPAPPIQNLLAVLAGVLMMKLLEGTS